MRFKKLLMSMLVGAIVSGSSIHAYAAENVNIVTQENITTESNQDSNITVTATDTTNPTGVVTDAVIADTNDSTSNETTTVETEVKDDTQVTEETTKNEEVEVKKEVETKKETKVQKKKEAKKETPKVVTKKVNYSKADLRLLSALIYCEANGESYNGKLAVGIVVMNRKRSSAFPDTVKGVIYQRYQFGPVNNGTLKRALAEYDKGRFTSAAEKECIKAAKEALSGTKTIKINGKKRNFSKYLFFSGRLRGCTLKLGNHQFK